MKFGTVLIFLILAALLTASMFLAYSGLGQMPEAGWIAMVAGIGFSIIIGCGLMALLFYSNRQGYDDPPKLEDSEARRR
ncbi:MAG TPA: hypothetical protein VM842_07635 [Nitrospira sp.]|nr:hypothetical protein [Nitrospira sp.]